MCSIQQQHLKQYPDPSLKPHYPGTSMKPNYDTGLHPQMHPYMQKESQLPPYMQKEMQYSPQCFQKFNMQPPQYGTNYSPESTSFLATLSKINPRMAQSIINDPHIREASVGYQNIEQNQHYGQRLYPTSYQTNHRNSVPQGYNCAQQYGYKPDSYRLPQYQPQTTHDLSTRQPYRDISMNYAAVPQKISPNYTQCAQLEYSQHYQHRRYQMPSEYYPQNYKNNYIQNQDLPPVTETAVPSARMKQFWESWGEDEVETVAEVAGTNQEQEKRKDERPTEQLYVLGTTEIPRDSLGQYVQIEALPESMRELYENGSIIIKAATTTSDNPVQNVEVVASSNRINILDHKRILPSSPGGEQVVNLHILETSTENNQQTTEEKPLWFVETVVEQKSPKSMPTISDMFEEEVAREQIATTEDQTECKVEEKMEDIPETVEPTKDSITDSIKTEVEGKANIPEEAEDDRKTKTMEPCSVIVNRRKTIEEIVQKITSKKNCEESLTCIEEATSEPKETEEAEKQQSVDDEDSSDKNPLEEPIENYEEQPVDDSNSEEITLQEDNVSTEKEAKIDAFKLSSSNVLVYLDGALVEIKVRYKGKKKIITVVPYSGDSDSEAEEQDKCFNKVSFEGKSPQMKDEVEYTKSVLNKEFDKDENGLDGEVTKVERKEILEDVGAKDSNLVEDERMNPETVLAAEAVTLKSHPNEELALENLTEEVVKEDTISEDKTEVEKLAEEELVLENRTEHTILEHEAEGGKPKSLLEEEPLLQNQSEGTVLEEKADVEELTKEESILKNHMEELLKEDTVLENEEMLDHKIGTPKLEVNNSSEETPANSNETVFQCQYTTVEDKTHEDQILEATTSTPDQDFLDPEEAILKDEAPTGEIVSEETLPDVQETVEVDQPLLNLEEIDVALETEITEETESEEVVPLETESTTPVEDKLILKTGEEVSELKKVETKEEDKPQEPIESGLLETDVSSEVIIGSPTSNDKVEIEEAVADSTQIVEQKPCLLTKASRKHFSDDDTSVKSKTQTKIVTKKRKALRQRRVTIAEDSPTIIEDGEPVVKKLKLRLPMINSSNNSGSMREQVEEATFQKILKRRKSEEKPKSDLMKNRDVSTKSSKRPSKELHECEVTTTTKTVEDKIEVRPANDFQTKTDESEVTSSTKVIVNVKSFISRSVSEDSSDSNQKKRLTLEEYTNRKKRLSASAAIEVPSESQKILNSFTKKLLNPPVEKKIIDINEFDIPTRSQELDEIRKSPSYVLENQETVKSYENDLNFQLPLRFELIKQKQKERNDLLMRRFLNNEKLSEDEMQKVKEIIHCKRMLVEMNKLRMQKLANEHNVYKRLEPNSNLKLHLKKIQPRKRFRNLYAESSSDSDETRSTICRDPRINRRLHDESESDYLAYQTKVKNGVPKIIIKRRCPNLMQPYVKLERSPHIDLMAKRRRVY